MAIPRFRLFAGPNGSGKSTLFNKLRAEGAIHTEFYINADSIEKKIKENGNFNFNAYGIKVSNKEFLTSIEKSGLYERSVADVSKLEIKRGVLEIKLNPHEINSYLSSFVAAYLTEKLIQNKISFCFETVMSHQSKIEIIKKAKKAGYKTYLYFVTTQNAELNKARVSMRVLQGGHAVDKQKITERYIRSLSLLPQAIGLVDKGYVIDNTESFKLLCETSHGKATNIANDYPQWLTQYYKPR